MARQHLKWLAAHYLQHRKIALGGLILLAALLQAAAAVGMAYVAGFSAVRSAAASVSWPWVGAIVGGLVVSFVGYFTAYRGVYQVEGGPQLSRSQVRAVVVGGFGGFLAHGGSALDDYALRAGGADQREASVRVSALAGLEHGAAAVIGTAAGITVLVQGRTQPPLDFSIPWSVLPLPGFAIAFLLAERFRGRMRRRRGWRGKMGVFLDSIHLNRELFLRPATHGVGAAGMALFWLADAFAVWAALAAFGFWMDPAALFLGYATGMVFTRRTGPLGGAGVLMVILPVTIWYSGAPLAVAVVAVFAYRVLSLWLPMPFSFACLPELRRMGKAGVPHAEQEAEAPGEPALRREPGE